MNHGNEPPGSIAAQWIRAIFSVSMRSVRAAHTVLCYTKCFGTLDVKLVILAFPVARMRSVILPFVPCLILIFKPIRIILVEIFWVVIFVAQTVRAVVRAAGLVLRWGAWFVLRLMIDRSFKAMPLQYSRFRCSAVRTSSFSWLPQIPDRDSHQRGSATQTYSKPARNAFRVSPCWLCQALWMSVPHTAFPDRADRHFEVLRSWPVFFAPTLRGGFFLQTSLFCPTFFLLALFLLCGLLCGDLLAVCLGNSL